MSTASSYDAQECAFFCFFFWCLKVLGILIDFISFLMGRNKLSCFHTVNVVQILTGKAKGPDTNIICTQSRCVYKLTRFIAKFTLLIFSPERHQSFVQNQGCWNFLEILFCPFAIFTTTENSYAFGRWNNVCDG